MQLFKTNNLFKKLKKTAQGIATILKLQGFYGKVFGYYIPYPYAAYVRTPKSLYPLKSLTAILDVHLNTYKSLCLQAAKYNETLKNFSKGAKDKPLTPRFNQDWFTGLDGAFAYTLVRTLRPNIIIEIGAGFSTRFLNQPGVDGGFSTQLYAINPKTLHGADKLCTAYFDCTLDKAPRDIFDKLQAGDILFVDASHLLMPGTDLELLFMDIIPALKNGVYIHFHDIFLPDNYPNDADWNYWAFNEQSYLATLLYGGGYKPVMPVAYITKYHPYLCKDIFAPKHPRGHQSSFWIVKETVNNI